jgi:ribosomal-protein-alanine N-acetyltransferase
MLLEIARSGPALGVTDLTLEVRAGNTPAKLLYRRFGFAPVGIRRNYYPETGEDGIVMWAYGIDAAKYLARLDEIEARLRSPL